MSDPIFPDLHIRPARGWLNDPNGLCRIDGRWHVFFQYNPSSPRHEAISWGHVSSTDLLRWEEHPIAFSPRPDGADRAGCWSGCVVDDGGTPTAVYTAVPGHAADATVALASSDRHLVEWRQHEAPVVGTPAHPSVSEARDPFVFTVDGRRYAVQGCGRPETGAVPLIMAYACDDLEHWDELGPMITADDPLAGEIAAADIWECPGFVPLGSQWLLVISLWRLVDGAGVLSGVRWFLGDLHTGDDRLQFVPRTGGVLDTGPSHYAPQLVLVDDRVLTWAWSWELDRSPEQIEEAGWAGVLTFPRELTVRDGQLIIMPAEELTGLRTADLGELREITGESAFEIVTDGPVELNLHTGDHRQTVLPHGAFDDGPVRILVDGSVIEAFGAATSFTTRAYPAATSVWTLSTPAQIYRLGLAPAAS